MGVLLIASLPETRAVMCCDHEVAVTKIELVCSNIFVVSGYSGKLLSVTILFVYLTLFTVHFLLGIYGWTIDGLSGLSWTCLYPDMQTMCPSHDVIS